MVEIEKGSGNVFADLDFPEPETHQVKATLVLRISNRIKSLGLSQAQAADRMGMAQPDVSKMLNGQFRPISLEKLIRRLLFFTVTTLTIRSLKRPGFFVWRQSASPAKAMALCQ